MLGMGKPGTEKSEKELVAFRAADLAALVGHLPLKYGGLFISEGATAALCTHLGKSSLWLVVFSTDIAMASVLQKAEKSGKPKAKDQRPEKVIYVKKVVEVENLSVLADFGRAKKGWPEGEIERVYIRRDFTAYGAADGIEYRIENGLPLGESLLEESGVSLEEISNQISQSGRQNREEKAKSHSSDSRSNVQDSDNPSSAGSSSVERDSGSKLTDDQTGNSELLDEEPSSQELYQQEEKQGQTTKEREELLPRDTSEKREPDEFEAATEKSNAGDSISEDQVAEGQVVEEKEGANTPASLPFSDISEESLSQETIKSTSSQDMGRSEGKETSRKGQVDDGGSSANEGPSNVSSPSVDSLEKEERGNSSSRGPSRDESEEKANREESGGDLPEESDDQNEDGLSPKEAEKGSAQQSSQQKKPQEKEKEDFSFPYDAFIWSIVVTILRKYWKKSIRPEEGLTITVVTDRSLDAFYRYAVRRWGRKETEVLLEKKNEFKRQFMHFARQLPEEERENIVAGEELSEEGRNALE